MNLSFATCAPSTDNAGDSIEARLARIEDKLDALMREPEHRVTDVLQ
jgi:hypothetical protein